MGLEARNITGSEQVDSGLIDEVENCDHMILSDEFALLKVAICGKNGCDIEVFFDSEEGFDEFIRMLNHYGFNCYIEQELDHTNLGSLMAFMEEDDPESEEMLSRDIVARVYISRKDYSPWFFRLNSLIFHIDSSIYHRRLGKFYGYPEQDIEAFAWIQKPLWKKRLWMSLGLTREKPLLDTEMLEKYGEDLDEQDRKVFRIFTDHKLADSKERFERQVEKSKRWAGLMRENDVDLDSYIDDLVWD
ncbi:MAG: hypothetical protein ABEJ99_04455 [Candidatus Nanohaloarchaea archaeon]